MRAGSVVCWIVGIVMILGGILAASVFISNVNAVTVNTTFYSVNVSDNWAYMKAKLPDQDSSSGILLIPTEFRDYLMKIDEQGFQQMLDNLSVYSFMLADTNYPFRNVPLEIYTQHRFNNTSEETMRYKTNATIDGEKALKFYSAVADSSTVSDEEVGYYVIHDGVPYMLEYSATVKDFEKYLPEFEQMIKTIRFVDKK